MRQEIAYLLIALVVLGLGVALWRAAGRRKRRDGPSLRIDLFGNRDSSD